MELSDLLEGRSYAIRYGVDDEEHEFDGYVFERLWYSDVRGESLARLPARRVIAQRITAE